MSTHWRTAVKEMDEAILRNCLVSTTSLLGQMLALPLGSSASPPVSVLSLM